MLRSLTGRIVLVLIATVFMCAIVAKADIVQDGLIAYYSFESGTIDGDTIVDTIGGSDGFMNGVEIVRGKIGDAGEFNGVDGKVTIDGNDDLNFNGVEEFTVAAWIFVNGISGGTCCGPIIGQRDRNGWAMRYDNRDGPNFVELISSPGWVGDAAGFGLPVPDEEWHYVTGVLGDGQILMYLDGELMAETAFGGTVVTDGGTETELGGASDGFFTGIIDEALIYNRALTEAEVIQNFESTVFFAVEPGNKLAVTWGEMKK